MQGGQQHAHGDAHRFIAVIMFHFLLFARCGIDPVAEWLAETDDEIRGVGQMALHFIGAQVGQGLEPLLRGTAARRTPFLPLRPLRESAVSAPDR